MRRQHPIYKRINDAYRDVERDGWLTTLLLEMFETADRLAYGQETQLYAVWDEARDAIKVGIGANPTERVTVLQIGNPNELMLLAACPGTKAMEQLIHRHLAGWRIRGEWFEANVHVLASVCLIASGEDIALDLRTGDMPEWADSRMTIDHLTGEFAEVAA